MYKFSKSSSEKLETCDKRIVKVILRALELSEIDFGIAWGHRDELAQNEAYMANKSTLKFPHSKHNSNPSRAVDIYAYVGGVNWESKYYYYLAGVILAVAKEMDVNLRWGGNWDRDGDFSDNSFNDLGHFELV